jgi:hypothetical protein
MLPNLPVRRRRWRGPALASLGVLIVGSASLWALEQRRESARTPALMQPIAVPTPAPSVPVAPAPATTVSLRIETQPADALVTRERDGVVLGRTPLELHLTREAGHLAVALEKDGFRTTRAELTLDRDGSALVEMVPVPASAPPAPAASKAHHHHAAAPAEPAPSTPAPAPPAPIKDGTLDPYGN